MSHLVHTASLGICIEEDISLRSSLLPRSRVQLCHCEFRVVVWCKPKVHAGIADHRVWFDAVFLAEWVVQLCQGSSC